jgi:hypothetical protein
VVIRSVSGILGQFIRSVLPKIHWVRFGYRPLTTALLFFVHSAQQSASIDIIVFLGGLNESLEAEMLDRTSIALPDAQANLIKNLSILVNIPKVLVLFNGGIEEALPAMDSVIEAWYPGRTVALRLPLPFLQLSTHRRQAASHDVSLLVRRQNSDVRHEHADRGGQELPLPEPDSIAVIPVWVRPQLHNAFVGLLLVAQQRGQSRL